MSLFDLSGKKALVTGGSRGIGYAMAEGLLEAGAEVAIVSQSERVFEAARSLHDSTGQKVAPVQADLSDRARIQSAFDACVDQLGTLDILVANHGTVYRAPVDDFPLEEWQRILDVTLTSVFLLNQMAGRVMLPKGYGKIINTASLLSFSGGLTVPAYAASKGGVARMTQAFANEWAGRGVHVNAIVPGYIHTDLNHTLLMDPSRGPQLLNRIPAGRWGTPDDLKGVTVFLASAASDYVDGTLIPVDGGWMGR